MSVEIENEICLFQSAKIYFQIYLRYLRSDCNRHRADDYMPMKSATYDFKLPVNLFDP